MPVYSEEPHNPANLVESRFGYPHRVHRSSAIRRYPDPVGSVERFRQMPKGLIPNFNFGFSCRILFERPQMKRFTFSLRQSSLIRKPLLAVASVRPIVGKRFALHRVRIKIIIHVDCIDFIPVDHLKMLSMT